MHQPIGWYRNFEMSVCLKIIKNDLDVSTWRLNANDKFNWNLALWSSFHLWIKYREDILLWKWFCICIIRLQILYISRVCSARCISMSLNCWNRIAVAYFLQIWIYNRARERSSAHHIYKHRLNSIVLTFEQYWPIKNSMSLPPEPQLIII